MPTLYKQWYVSFDLLVKGTAAAATTIFRIGDNVANVGNDGSRIPYVGLNSQNGKELSFATSLNGNFNYGWYDDGSNFNVWTRVVLSQLKIDSGDGGVQYRYTIRINDENKKQEINTAAKTYTNMKAYASDNFQYAATDARIDNLVIATGGM